MIRVIGAIRGSPDPRPVSRSTRRPTEFRHRLIGNTREIFGQKGRYGGTRIEITLVMQIKHSALASVIVAVAAVAFASAAQSPQDPPVAQQQEQPAAKQAVGYAWAEACKSCHTDIYDSWAKTKHSRTIDRLSASEQAQACIGCHTTGGVGKLEVEGNFVNKGVQCEGCHGPGAAHVAEPTNKVGLTKIPSAKTCETCHNDKSPHFRGFVYQGMSKLSHAIPKK